MVTFLAIINTMTTATATNKAAFFTFIMMTITKMTTSTNTTTVSSMVGTTSITATLGLADEMFL
jgi:hypothetical protein